MSQDYAVIDELLGKHEWLTLEDGGKLVISPIIELVLQLAIKEYRPVIYIMTTLAV